MKTDRSRLSKITGIVLATMMAMTVMFFGTASAFGETCNTDSRTISMSLLYRLLNDGNTSPEESFSFTISNDGVEESSHTVATMTAFPQTTYTIEHPEGSATVAGNAASNTINLPDYDTVGIYRYKIRQKAGTTAGVVYDDKTVILQVTVTNCQTQGATHEFDRSYIMYYEDDEDNKITSMENTFQSGALAVTKSVTGLLGDTRKEFNVDVEFTAPEGKTVANDITYNDGKAGTIKPGDWTDGKAKVQIAVKDGETVTFGNVPYGVTYDVKEADYSGEGYEAEHVFQDSSKKVDTAVESVTIKNSKGGGIPTGLYHRVLPLMAGIAVVIAMMAIVVMRKRRNNQTH